MLPVLAIKQLQKCYKSIADKMMKKGRIQIAYIAFILLLTVLLYSNSIKNQFVNWDDDVSIIKNTDVHSFEKGHVFNMFNNFFKY